MNKKFVVMTLAGGSILALALLLLNSSQHEVAIELTSRESSLKRLPTSIDPHSSQTSDRARTALDFMLKFRPHGLITKLDFNEKSLINIGRDYELSLEYRATSFGRFKSSLGKRINMVNGFVIYRPVDGNLTVEEARKYENDSFPVVKGLNNSMLGMLTGRLIVKCMDPSFDVEAELGVKVLYKSPGLGVTYAQTPEGTDLISLYESLKDYGQIERADLEILQGGVIPR